MATASLLADAFERVRSAVHGVVSGLPAEHLNTRLAGHANSITWLVWHLTRIQDDHVAAAAGAAQVWTAHGWAERFGLPVPASDTGFGHTAAQVAAVQVPAAHLLTGYHDAVHASTLAFVSSLTDADLDRIVDRSFTPPVSLGTRLVSVLVDDLEHVGQAAFVRGVLERH